VLLASTTRLLRHRKAALCAPLGLCSREGLLECALARRESRRGSMHRRVRHRAASERCWGAYTTETAVCTVWHGKGQLGRGTMSLSVAAVCVVWAATCPISFASATVEALRSRRSTSQTQLCTAAAPQQDTQTEAHGLRAGGWRLRHVGLAPGPTAPMPPRSTSRAAASAVVSQGASRACPKCLAKTRRTCLHLGRATWVMCHAMDARACDVQPQGASRTWPNCLAFGDACVSTWATRLGSCAADRAASTVVASRRRRMGVWPCRPAKGQRA
jgi:hypothetical protein